MKRRLRDAIPLPPRDSETRRVTCDECEFACKYRVYRWPVGEQGGVKAAENAFGRDLPENFEQGGWIIPKLHNIVIHEGKAHHLVVAPEAHSEECRHAKNDDDGLQMCFELEEVYADSIAELIGSGADSLEATK